MLASAFSFFLSFFSSSPLLMLSAARPLSAWLAAALLLTCLLARLLTFPIHISKRPIWWAVVLFVCTENAFYPSTLAAGADAARLIVCVCVCMMCTVCTTRFYFFIKPLCRHLTQIIQLGDLMRHFFIIVFCSSHLVRVETFFSSSIVCEKWKKNNSQAKMTQWWRILFTSIIIIINNK